MADIKIRLYIPISSVRKKGVNRRKGVILGRIVNLVNAIVNSSFYSNCAFFLLSTDGNRWLRALKRANRRELPTTGTEREAAVVRRGGRAGGHAFVFYSACAVAALWIPLAIAALITLVWVFWTVFGIHLDQGASS